MAVVTISLIALAFSQPARGAAGVPGLLVYSFAAGFGLEFLGSAWRGARARREDPHA
jgi:hypothetical protein